MNLKIRLTVLLVSYFGLMQPGFSQNATNAPAVPEAKKADNYTVQFLLVANGNKEMLMMKNSTGWHLPAIRSNESQSVKEAMDSLAKSMGLGIRDLKLAGLYTHKFEGLPDHNEISFRTHYSATLKSGKIIQPVDTAKYFQWMPVEEALPKFHFEFLRQQVEPILRQPGKVWGGSFLIIWKGDKYMGSRVLEKPYVLAD